MRNQEKLQCQPRNGQTPIRTHRGNQLQLLPLLMENPPDRHPLTTPLTRPAPLPLRAGSSWHTQPDGCPLAFPDLVEDFSPGGGADLASSRGGSFSAGRELRWPPRYSAAAASAPLGVPLLAWLRPGSCRASGSVRSGGAASPARPPPGSTALSAPVLSRCTAALCLVQTWPSCDRVGSYQGADKAGRGVGLGMGCPPQAGVLASGRGVRLRRGCLLQDRVFASGRGAGLGTGRSPGGGAGFCASRCGSGHPHRWDRGTRFHQNTFLSAKTLFGLK